MEETINENLVKVGQEVHDLNKRHKLQNVVTFCTLGLVIAIGFMVANKK